MIFARAKADDPATSARYAKRRLQASPTLEFFETAHARLADIFAVLMAAAGLLLLLGCANVGNAILGRAMSRTGEIATRLALGATRGQVARLLLTESAVLALAATVLAWGATELVATLLAGARVMPNFPPLERAATDWRVFGWAALASIVATRRGPRADVVGSPR